jgi:hypothetical protein
MEYHAECTRCEGLCCVSLPFDRSESFAFDKQADVPCRHLTGRNRCAIHRRLVPLGQSGCARYDCLGAGQRVTALARGRSWRSHPERARVLFEAFRRLKRLHELVVMLLLAQRLALPAEAEAQRRELHAALEPPEGFTLEGLRTFDVERAERNVAAFLGSLRPLFSGGRALRFDRSVASLSAWPPES